MSSNTNNSIKNQRKLAYTSSNLTPQLLTKTHISVAVAHAERAFAEGCKYRYGAIGRKSKEVVEVDCYTLIVSSLFWDKEKDELLKISVGSEAAGILIRANPFFAFDRAKVKNKITSETKFRPGMILFMPGHLGICVSETHSIEATAAKKGGILKEPIRGGVHDWTHWFEDINFDYTCKDTDITVTEKVKVFFDVRRKIV